MNRTGTACRRYRHRQRTAALAAFSFANRRVFDLLPSHQQPQHSSNVSSQPQTVARQINTQRIPRPLRRDQRVQGGTGQRIHRVGVSAIRRRTSRHSSVLHQVHHHGTSGGSDGNERSPHRIPKTRHVLADRQAGVRTVRIDQPIRQRVGVPQSGCVIVVSLSSVKQTCRDSFFGIHFQKVLAERRKPGYVEIFAAVMDVQMRARRKSSHPLRHPAESVHSTGGKIVAYLQLGKFLVHYGSNIELRSPSL